MTHGMIIEQIPPILHAVCILKLFFIQIVIYKKQEKSVPFTSCHSLQFSRAHCLSSEQKTPVIAEEAVYTEQ